MSNPITDFFRFMSGGTGEVLALREEKAPEPAIILRSRTAPSDPRFRGGCLFIFAGNRRTKGSYLHLGIPLRFIKEGVNSLFAFRDDLSVIVEIIQDEEFALWCSEEGEGGYAVGVRNGSFTISITESRQGSIIELCARGFADICKRFSLRGWHEDLFREIERAIRKIMEAIAEEQRRKEEAEARERKPPQTGTHHPARRPWGQDRFFHPPHQNRVPREEVSRRRREVHRKYRSL
jgi:hypothetical protein